MINPKALSSVIDSSLRNGKQNTEMQVMAESGGSYDKVVQKVDRVKFQQRLKEARNDSCSFSEWSMFYKDPTAAARRPVGWVQPGKGAPVTLIRDKVKDAEEGPITDSLTGLATDLN